MNFKHLLIFLLWILTPVLLAQDLIFRADALSFPAQQLTIRKCVQVGLYMTNTGKAATSWAQISATLEYSDPNGFIDGTPFVKSADFGAVATGGILNPGVVISNGSGQTTICNSIHVVNAATLGLGPATHLAQGIQPSDLIVENLNANTRRILAGAANFSGNNFTLLPDIEYLFAIIEFPIAGISGPSSFSGVSGIQIEFLPDSQVPDGNIVSDGIITQKATTQNGRIHVTGSAQTPDRVGIFRPSTNTIYLDVDGNEHIEIGGPDRITVMGAPGDQPLTGDWNHDMTDELGLHRSTIFSRFFLDSDGNDMISGSDRQIFMGANTDVAIRGDWNGDGGDEVGLFRSSNNQFFLDMNDDGSITGADVTFFMGAPGDLPIVGDWNGDGIDELGVYRTTGLFFLDLDNSKKITLSDAVIRLGGGTAFPLIGDWNGDGVDKVGIYTPSFNIFWLDSNNDYKITQADTIFGMGTDGDIPLAGKW